MAANRQLGPAQRAIIRHLVTLFDTTTDSVVITNPLVEGSPIVHVTEAWQNMCGYRAREAVGQNPRLTQGSGSDANTIAAMRHAISQQQPCKVRLINYRGYSGEPFWNCLTVHPIFYQRQLVLFAARLQDYSYRLTKLISFTPAQFCKANDRCVIRLSSVRGALSMAQPVRIDAHRLVELGEGAENEAAGLEEGSDADIDKTSADVLPRLPVQHVKRLGLPGLPLEPEYLLDRLQDECSQLQLPCKATEMVAGGAELMRLEVFQQSGQAGGDGVRAVLHVMGEDAEGHHCISFTRLSGDTFQFHALYRSLRKRLADLIPGTTTT